MNKHITIVGGLGRCGTTLLMRMFDACGVPCIGNKVAFEDNRSCDIQKNNSAWLKEAEGKIIKVIDLHRMNLPLNFKYRIIWIMRDYNEQAKSITKFTKLLVEPTINTNSYWKKVMRDLPHDTKYAFDKFNRWGVNWMLVNFEDLLRADQNTINNIQNFSGFYMGIENCFSILIKRSPECRKDLSIEQTYLNYK